MLIQQEKQLIIALQPSAFIQLAKISIVTKLEANYSKSIHKGTFEDCRKPFLVPNQ